MDTDKLFLNNYWREYENLIINERDDSKIISFRDAIKETVNKNGKLYFVGNGASASLSSHAATDFTKQAKIESIAFNDHNLITALANDYGYDNWVAKAIQYYVKPQDRVIFISVSGNSPNLVNGLKLTTRIQDSLKKDYILNDQYQIKDNLLSTYTIK